MDEQKTYYGVIGFGLVGDVIGSRQLENRNEVQLLIKNALCEINQKYESDIASNFMLTLGDEFQGLLFTGRYLMEIMQHIKSSLYPVRIKFGIGYGTMSTDISSDRPLGADGSAYILARKGVNEIRVESDKRKVSIGSTRVHFENNLESSEWFNALLDACSVIENSWTTRQHETVSLLLDGTKSQSDVAAILKVGQPAIQKSIASSNFYFYRQSYDFLKRKFTEYSC
jgi:hypothetical protein